MIAMGLQEQIRIQLYKDYIEESLRRHAPSLSVTIALDVHDIPEEQNGSPLFCFQKTVKSRHILLPDVDFMQNGWYEKQYIEPAVSHKKPRGIFVGSSTGGGTLTANDVLEARTPRLNMGRLLHGHAHIDFNIAAAVQCDTPETEALLVQQPYFSRPVSWDEQLQSKFLISIDGNGATCSRVVNSLRSQSVLVKCTSPYMLYYFHGLQPWRHYIPVDTPEDLDRLMDEENNGAIDTVSVVEQANLFFDRFLCKAAVHEYGARLLLAYARDVAPKGLPDERRRTERSLIAGMCTHVANIGDVWSGSDEWAGDPSRRQSIEGLLIVPVPGINPALLRYRCLIAGGGMTEWSDLGSFSGSRGQAKMVSGIEFAPRDGSDRALLAGLVRFTNGAVHTISSHGGVYRETDGNAVTALKIWLS